MSDPKDLKTTASLRFKGKTSKDVYARQVFDHFAMLPDPDSPAMPDARMKAQTILIEALCALGERLESEGVAIRDRSDVPTLKDVLDGLQEIRDQIAALQTREIVTPAQVEQINAVVDNSRISQTFALNMAKSIKPGKVKGT